MLRLVDFNEEHLEITFNWLSDPEIKRLTDAPDFTREEQLKWFASLNTRNDYIIYIVEFEETPIGAVGIKNIKDKEGEYWTYIGEKEFWGKGLGKQIYLLGEKIAVERGLEKMIIIIANKTNERSIKLHEKLGYKIVDEKPEGYIMIKSLKP